MNAIFEQDQLNLYYIPLKKRHNNTNTYCGDSYEERHPFQNPGPR